MPNYIHTSSNWTCSCITTFYIPTQMHYSECWKLRKLLCQQEEHFQRIYVIALQKELHRKEMEKYPLFFLKEGII